MLRSETLFTGQLVSISDVVCRASNQACGAEEYATSDQLVLTRAGVFVKHAGRAQVVAEPTHALFFNRGEPYRVSHPAAGGDDCTVMTFAAAPLHEVVAYDAADACGSDAAFSVSHAPLAPDVLLRCQRLRQALRARAAEALQAEETALDVLHRTLGDARRVRGTPVPCRRRDTARTRRDLAEATKLLLASRPAASHSLASLARAVNSSPFHLSRVFRQEVGMPVHKYLIRLRLALALEWLAEDISGLSALAMRLGFSSHSHFTTLFRRAFGVSPSSVRRAAPARRHRELGKTLPV